MKPVQVFLGADLRQVHRGLKDLAEEHACSFEDLAEGEAFVFINRAKNRIKTLSWNGVLSYINFEGQNRTLDMDAIHEIPRALDSSGHMNYSRALRVTLQKKLGVRRFLELEVI